MRFILLTHRAISLDGLRPAHVQFHKSTQSPLERHDELLACRSVVWIHSVPVRFGDWLLNELDSSAGVCDVVIEQQKTWIEQLIDGVVAAAIVDGQIQYGH